jgi:hypothetical protein
MQQGKQARRYGGPAFREQQRNRYPEKSGLPLCGIGRLGEKINRAAQGYVANDVENR